MREKNPTRAKRLITPFMGVLARGFGAWVLIQNYRIHIAHLPLAFLYYGIISYLVKIPYYIISDAPVHSADPVLFDWVRSNDHILRLVVSDIKKRVLPREECGPGRPRVDEDIYIAIFRKEISGEENAKSQSEVIKIMLRRHPISDSTCRDVIRRFEKSGLIKIRRGEFSWSPHRIWWQEPEDLSDVTDLDAN